jgi:hypothetical protein
MKYTKFVPQEVDEAPEGSVLNSLFLSKMDDPAYQAKIANAGASYIRDKLRETSFARRILPAGTPDAEVQALIAKVDADMAARSPQEKARDKARTKAKFAEMLKKKP